MVIILIRTSDVLLQNPSKWIKIRCIGCVCTLTDLMVSIFGMFVTCLHHSVDMKDCELQLKCLNTTERQFFFGIPYGLNVINYFRNIYIFKTSLFFSGIFGLLLSSNLWCFILHLCNDVHLFRIV